MRRSTSRSFAGWSDDGLTWERVDTESAAAPPRLPSFPERRPPRSRASILAASHFVRVDLKRLDDVMRRVADLVVTRSRLEASLTQLERALPPPIGAACRK